MIYIYGEKQNLRIVYSETNLTDLEKSQASLVIEALPEPEIIENKIPVLWLENNSLYYKYVDKPILPTRFEKLQQMVNEGKITQEEMNELL